MTDEERATYEWQIWVEGFGEAGQEKLRNASVLVSRCGGLGGNVAMQLAAAGVGKLVLAQGGILQHSDLNRQTLMTHAHLGKPRIDSVVERIRAFNPRVEIVAHGENISAANVRGLVEQSDLTMDCAPLFEERYLLNAEGVRQRKPMVECAVMEFEMQLTTIVPGETPCLACLYPEKSDTWKRQFPVFGAVSCAAGGLAAVEAIKLLGKLDGGLVGRLLVADLRTMAFKTHRIRRLRNCLVCGHL